MDEVLEIATANQTHRPGGVALLNWPNPTAFWEGMLAAIAWGSGSTDGNQGPNAWRDSAANCGDPFLLQCYQCQGLGQMAQSAPHWHPLKPTQVRDDGMQTTQWPTTAI